MSDPSGLSHGWLKAIAEVTALARKARKRETDRAWALRNREKLRAKAKARYAANPAKGRAATSRYRLKNPEKRKACDLAWRKANPLWWKQWNRVRVQRRKAGNKTSPNPPTG